MPFTSAGTFVSTTDLSAYLGRDVTTDPAALQAVDFACDVCRNWTGKTYNAGTTTETFDGTGVDSLRLTETPVTAVTAVTVSDGATPPAWTTAGTLDYALNGNGILYVTNTAGTATFGSVWPVGRQNIRVAYQHGFTSVPREVRGVALSLASRFLVQGPALFESLGDVNVRYAAASTELTPTEQLYLYRHRRR